MNSQTSILISLSLAFFHISALHGASIFKSTSWSSMVAGAPPIMSLSLAGIEKTAVSFCFLTVTIELSQVL